MRQTHLREEYGLILSTYKIKKKEKKTKMLGYSRA